MTMEYYEERKLYKDLEKHYILKIKYVLGLEYQPKNEYN